MRVLILALSLVLGACAAQTSAGEHLTPADSATAVLVGGPLAMNTVSQRPAAEGQDPLVTMTLLSADGRRMRFQEANHANNDVMATAPGGPLAQAMGLFGQEAPQLYRTVEGGSGAPFICAPEGPLMLGVYRAESGEVTVVGLKSAFEFETRADGVNEALPYSPDHVCSRMKFRVG